MESLTAGSHLTDNMRKEEENIHREYIVSVKELKEKFGIKGNVVGIVIYREPPGEEEKTEYSIKTLEIVDRKKRKEAKGDDL